MSKRSEIREKRQKRRQRQQLTFILIVVGILLIIAAIFILPYLQPIPDVFARPMADGTAMGDPNAPVRMEEYADYQCHYCQKFSAETEPKLVEKYVATGKLYIVFKNLTLYPTSTPLAEAALCASEQNKFWQYHDMLFGYQNSTAPNKYSEKKLISYAKEIDLDVDNFSQCIAERRYQDEVKQIAAEASAAGIKATPTFIINGKLVEGFLPFEEFQKEIEAALAGR